MESQRFQELAGITGRSMRTYSLFEPSRQAPSGLIYPFRTLAFQLASRSKTRIVHPRQQCLLSSGRLYFNTIHTLITTKRRVTSAASVPAAAADKAKRRPSGASASGRAKWQERSVPAPASARVWAAPARRVPAAARRRTAVVALAPHPRHYAIASCRPGSPLVASARARASRRWSRRKVLTASSRRRRC